MLEGKHSGEQDLAIGSNAFDTWVIVKEQEVSHSNSADIYIKFTRNYIQEN